MTRDLRCYTLTLTEAAEALAERQFTSLQLAESQLTRVQATDAAVCAWESLDPDHVRREAARWDATRPPGPLGGIDAATRRGLLGPDPSVLKPTALGRRFLNDLQALFLNTPSRPPGRTRNVPEVAPLVRIEATGIER